MYEVQVCQPELSTCGNCEIEFSTPAAEGIKIDSCHVLVHGVHCIYMYQRLCVEIHVHIVGTTRLVCIIDKV